MLNPFTFTTILLNIKSICFRDLVRTVEEFILVIVEVFNVYLFFRNVNALFRVLLNYLFR